MFFGKRREKSSEPPLKASQPEDDVPESERVVHGSYTVIPITKQLHNGNWIVHLVLEEQLPQGPRRYDFAGPMSEHKSREEARVVGVEHAVARLSK